MKALSIFLPRELLVCSAVVDISEAKAMGQPAESILSVSAMTGEQKSSAMPVPQRQFPAWEKKR
ncbi:hypothetical protein NPIL_361691, partial [Nephila pilipes]